MGSEYRISVRSSTSIPPSSHLDYHERLCLSDRPLNSSRFGHSAETWVELWYDVFAELDGVAFARSRVRVDAKLHTSDKHTGDEFADARWLLWCVRILPAGDKSSNGE